MKECPKCNSINIKEGQTGNGLGQLWIEPKKSILSSSIKLKVYICSNCGCIEFYTPEVEKVKVKF